MTTLIAEVYDAFLAAGAPEDEARAADQAIADDDHRFSKIEADLLVLKWLTGAVAAGMVSLVIKTFF